VRDGRGTAETAAAETDDRQQARVSRGIPLELVSLLLLLVAWQVLALLFPSRLLPGPVDVALNLADLAANGRLLPDLGKTLVRVATAFAIALVLGTAIGIALGRSRVADRLFSSWVVVGLNVPAIVIAIVLYIWLGLTEFALILAVILNKLPLVIATIREGVRSFEPAYDELGRAYRMPFGRRLRLVLAPQLMPFVLAAARTGLSLIWKIVLVFEVLGSDGGVGFRISVFFQFFDIKGILAYTTAFILVVFAFEYLVLRPLEARILRWRQPR
jgi:NitT/TauT family transport system permease protein